MAKIIIKEEIVKLNWLYFVIKKTYNKTNTNTNNTNTSTDNAGL